MIRFDHSLGATVDFLYPDCYKDVVDSLVNIAMPAQSESVTYDYMLFQFSPFSVVSVFTCLPDPDVRMFWLFILVRVCSFF